MLPYINREIKCAFRWYRAASLRHRMRLRPTDTDIPSKCIPSLTFPARTILPFQILVEAGTSGVDTWVIKDTSGATAYDMAAHIPLLVVEQYANPSRAIICLELPLVDTELPEGTFEMEITTAEGEVAYSETFKLQCATNGDRLENIDMQDGMDRWTHPAPFNTIMGAVPANSDLPTSGQEVFDAYVCTGDDLLYVWNGTTWDASTPANGTYFGTEPGGTYYLFSGGTFSLVDPDIFIPTGDATGSIGCWIGAPAIIPVSYEVPTDRLPGLVRIVYTIFRGSPIIGSVSVYAGGQLLATHDETNNGQQFTHLVYLQPGATIEFIPTSGFAGCFTTLLAYSIADGTDCMTKLVWGDCGDLGSVAYGIGNGEFRNILYLEEQGCGAVASTYDPTPQVSEETESDAEGASSATRRRKEVEWRMEISTMPWHVADALSEMVVSGDRRIMVPWGGGMDTMLTARMEIQWNGKARVADGAMLFRVDEATSEGGCCGAFDRPCPTPCGVADGIYGVDELVDGQTYLYSDGRQIGSGTIAHYCGFECEEPIDEFGFDSFSECPSRLAELASGVLMRWTGTEWTIAVGILSAEEVNEDCDDATVTAVIPPGYTGRVEWSEDGSTWAQTGAPFTASEAEDGVVVPIPAGAMYLRVVAMGFECDLGASLAVPAPCSCPHIVFSSNIDDLCGSLPQAVTVLAQPYASDGGPVLAMVDNGEAVTMEYRINGGGWVASDVQTTGAFYAIDDVPYTTPGDTIEVRLTFTDRPWCAQVTSQSFSCPV